jgi:hypothetical protein
MDYTTGRLDFPEDSGGAKGLEKLNTLHFWIQRPKGNKAQAAGEINVGGSAVAEHCLVAGSMYDRTGEPEGTPYALGFEMRLHWYCYLQGIGKHRGFKQLCLQIIGRVCRCVRQLSALYAPPAWGFKQG